MSEAADITEFERFARSLAVYAASWVASRQNTIVEHAREIFEEKALRVMVETYAEEKEASERSRRFEFVKACLGEDISRVDEEHEDVHTARARSYFEVLNDLIYERFCLQRQRQRRA